MDEHDMELEELEASIQNQTAKMTSLDAGPYGTLGSLVHVIRCLGRTIKDVARVLLKSKNDIIGSEALKELLHDYFACTDKITEFLDTLHVWLNGASGVSWCLSRVKTALHEFKTYKTEAGFGRTLLQRAVDGFMDADDPLVAEQLRANLRAIVDAETRLDNRLRAKNHQVDAKNMKRLRFYRKVTAAVLASIYIGLMVCAAVAASLSPAMVVMPVMVLAAIAAMNPTDYAKTCMNYVLAKYEDKIRTRRESLTRLMEASGPVRLHDLEEIRVLVQALRGKIQSSPFNKDSDVNTMIKDLEKKIAAFTAAAKDLESKRNKCCKYVSDARAKIIGTHFARWN